MRHLVWLRADLRTTDNKALAQACADREAEVACVYAITPAQWKQHDVAGCRLDLELRQLQQLQKELAACHIPLLLLHCPDYQGLPKALLSLCREHKIDAVFFNRQYEVNERARDQAVASALQAAGITIHALHDQCAVQPGRLLTGEGRFYSVFTHFKRAWLAAVLQEGVALLPPPRPRARRFCESDALPASIPGLSSHLDSAVAAAQWPAGEDAVLARLQCFCEQGLRHYASRRDLPAISGTSTLSPYLAMGAISVRQCLNMALQAKHESLKGETDIDTWISELTWRDFYKHILVGFPQVSRHQPFKAETRALPWRHDEAAFQRWREGRTGFPIVDAAMRQLQEIGWMHNRLRMIVAMFLCKDLFIDWRWGEQFFMQHLVDGDLAANNGGWQWCASTGNDAAPYFRVFNPTLQGQRFDPEGEFIRRYVPELRELSNKAIHVPYAGKQPHLLLAYPLPMVEHGAAKDFAIAQFQALRHA